MSRLIGSGNVGGVALSILQSHNLSCLEVNSRLYDRACAHNSLRRSFLYCKLLLREYSFHKANNHLLKSGGFPNFHSFSASNIISHHAQIAWKRILLWSYGGSVLLPIVRIACAVSLALTRSNLVAPCVIAFVVGKFALRQQTSAEAEPILTKPDLFARDLCSELAKLQTNAAAHKFSFSKKSIERAFGRKLFEIVEIFEEEPVASGSVAQVHQATLKCKYLSRDQTRCGCCKSLTPRSVEAI